jgi:hypothetical protein
MYSESKTAASRLRSPPEMYDSTKTAILNIFRWKEGFIQNVWLVSFRNYFTERPIVLRESLLSKDEKLSTSKDEFS